VNNIWQTCDKATICSKFSTESREGVSYRAIRSDPEYLDNWVDKLGLLCQPQHKIGFLGSSYFLGIITAMLVVPTLSDYFGRKNIFVATMVVSMIS
jgi:MFS family permease